MHQFARPPIPENFETAVQIHRDAVRAAIQQERSPEFPMIWKRFRTHFSTAQWGKCGFCEARVTGTQPGDVEHFHPKAAINDMSDDASEWGEEKADGSIEGRRERAVCGSGYWWLAYAWHNYLLACSNCNSKWKRNFFPVRGERRIPPSGEHPDVPLLLNPFDGPHPSAHLVFGDIGQVEPTSANDGQSVIGQATIRTVGLDRPSLRQARLEKARKAHRLAMEIQASTTQKEVARALWGFLEMGDEKYDYCGVVRTIFVQICGMTWEELEKLRPDLEPAEMSDAPVVQNAASHVALLFGPRVPPGS